MIIKFTRILIFLPFLVSCGFKVVNEYQLRNFDIIEIISSGDNRINFLLKKNLENDKENFSTKFKLNLETQKIKELKKKTLKMK